MALRYAGVDLLLDDPDGELAGFVERYLSLDDLRLFGIHSPSYSGRYDDLGIPAYPERTTYRFNTLYNPTGAVRWAFGLFLATTEQKNAIVAAAGVAGEILEITDSVDSATSIQARVFGEKRFSSSQGPGYFTGASSGSLWDDGIFVRMYALPPRPIADTSSGLWAIPLVDSRFYWQFHTAGSEPSLDAVANALGITLVHYAEGVSVPGSFGGVGRKYDNAAAFIESVAQSNGCTVVWETGETEASDMGVYNFKSPVDSLAVLPVTQRSGVGSYHRVAGGEIADNIASITPETVTVVFPKQIDGVPVEDGAVYTIEQNASDYLSTGSVSGTTKVFHVSEPAEFTDDVATTPDNETQLDAIATTLANQYYNRIKNRDDQTFAGIVHLSLGPNDDYAEYFHGFRRQDGSYAAMTRVQSLPYNFGGEQILRGVANTLGERGFWAQITDRDGDEYSWQEMESDGDGDFSVKTGGRTGEAGGDDPAFEINNSEANFNVAMNLIVWMRVGTGGEYLFDRGLTDEAGVGDLTKPLSDVDTWEINSQADDEAGVSFPDLLTKTGETIVLRQDSHGQTIYAERESAPGGCTRTPFSGTKTRVTGVELTINSASLSGDCKTVSIDYTLDVIETAECYSNGLLMSGVAEGSE